MTRGKIHPPANQMVCAVPMSRKKTNKISVMSLLITMRLVYCHLVEETVDVMKKIIVLCSSFLVDFNYMDDSELKIKDNISGFNGGTKEVVFSKGKHKYTERRPGYVHTTVNMLF